MEKKNNNKTVVIIAIVCVCCVAVMCVGTILYVKNSMNQPVTTPVADIPVSEVSGVSITVTDDNRNYVAEIQDKVEKGNISVRMTQNWVFKDGGKTSNAYLANSERNSYDLRFQLILADTGEVIMTSPDVPVGSCIENFPLSVTLEPGTYEGVVAHQQIENGEVVNTVRTNVQFSVK